MYIFSQDRNRIVNVPLKTEFQFLNDGSTIYYVNNRYDEIFLGKYVDQTRAKEVIQYIFDNICSLNRWVELPKE